MYFETETELLDTLSSRRYVRNKLYNIASEWEGSWFL